MRDYPVLRFVWLLLLCPAAFGQTTGNIEGRITDADGGPLPGVTIEAASSSLQGTRSVVSGRDGRYRMPGVPPGDYRVYATLPQFAPAE